MEEPLTLPPGPKRRVLAPSLLAMRRSPLTYLEELARDYGAVSSFRIMNRRIAFVNRPDLVQEVLVTQQANFEKGEALRKARFLLGDGLLTSEGSAHRRQRRLVQPAFHRARLESYAAAMTEFAVRVRERWNGPEPRNMTAEMGRLTLDVVGKTLFSSSVDQVSQRISTALSTVIDGFSQLMLPLVGLWMHLPFTAAHRMLGARRELNAIINALIAECRSQGEDRGDLLSTLVFSQDADRPGEGLSDEEIRDQALTLFLAGHETTANALTWTWVLLAQNPEAERRLQAELAAQLNGRTPLFSDLARLPYARKVLQESMRLYPPAWGVGRLAVEPVELGGFAIPPGTIVLCSQWVMHRNPTYFPEPQLFRPERWTEPMQEALPRFAYFPFGGGARVCIGENFAWMELVLLLATLAQTWRPRLEAGPSPVPVPRITLRPRDPVMMRVR